MGQREHDPAHRRAFGCSVNAQLYAVHDGRVGEVFAYGQYTDGTRIAFVMLPEIDGCPPFEVAIPLDELEIRNAPGAAATATGGDENQSHYQETKIQVSTVVQREEPRRLPIETIATEVVTNPAGDSPDIDIDLELHREPDGDGGTRTDWRVTFTSNGRKPEIHAWQIPQLIEALTAIHNTWTEEARRRRFAGVGVDHLFVIARHRDISISEVLAELGIEDA